MKRKIIVFCSVLLIAGVKILSIVLADSSLGANLVSEENTTTLSAKVKRIEVKTEKDDKYAIVHSEEYGNRIYISNLKIINNIHDLKLLDKGQIIYFRIDNTFLTDPFKDVEKEIVSLSTYNKVIFSLNDYNHFSKQRYYRGQSFIIVCFIIFLLILYYYFFIHKRYRSSFIKRMKTNERIDQCMSFINKYTPTKNYVRELYKNVSIFSIKWPIIVIIWFLFTGIHSSIWDYFEGDNFHLDWTTIIALVIFIALCLNNFILINAAYTKSLKLNKGNPIEVTMSISGNYIMQTDRGDRDRSLTDIKQAVITKNYYFLICNDICFGLKKDGFIQGSSQQFENFLWQNKLV